MPGFTRNRPPGLRTLSPRWSRPQVSALSAVTLTLSITMFDWFTTSNAVSCARAATGASTANTISRQANRGNLKEKALTSSSHTQYLRAATVAGVSAYDA